MMKKVLSILLLISMTVGLLIGCGSSKEKILIYSAAEDYRIEYMQQRGF